MRPGLMRWEADRDATADGRESATEIPTHDPPLSPRDEAVFLLHAAAEVEHALLVQYLYASYSLAEPPFAGPRPPANAAQLVRGWRRELVSIAIQEMGHLVTVQNLLRFIGGPLNFEREDFPFRSQLYPFPLALERLSRDSIAKYAAAEMPEVASPDAVLREIILRATRSSVNGRVNRVGALYRRLHQLFQSPGPTNGGRGLPDDAFRPDTAELQADPAHWPSHVDGFIVRKIRSRCDALDAITAVAEQGEGPAADAAASHFASFLEMFHAPSGTPFPESDPRLGVVDWVPTKAVPRDPATDASRCGSGRCSVIENDVARPLAQLFNVRYRILLASLTHYLLVPGGLGGAGGARSARGYLRDACFDEMLLRMKPVAAELTRLDLGPVPASLDGERLVAAPPFELDYTLALPDDECDRWRLHADLLEACLSLAAAILALGVGESLRAVLEETIDADRSRLAVVQGWIAAQCGCAAGKPA